MLIFLVSNHKELIISFFIFLLPFSDGLHGKEMPKCGHSLAIIGDDLGRKYAHLHKDNTRKIKFLN